MTSAYPLAASAVLSDLTLVRCAQSGERRAFDRLVLKYRSRIVELAMRYTRNRADAEDATQETFIKAYRALKSFKGDSSFYTWVYRIAVNKTINFLKQRKNRVQLSLNDMDFNAENDPDLVALVSEKTPRRDLNLSELQEKLNAAMLKLLIAALGIASVMMVSLGPPKREEGQALSICAE